MHHEEPERLMDVHRAAAFLAVSVHTLRAWTRQGRLRVVKFGRLLRYRHADVEEFVAANLVERQGR